MQQVKQQQGMLAAFVALVMCAALCVPGLAWAKGEPLASSPYDDAVAANIDNGEYLVDVVLEGGTGRATIASPAKLSVVDGKAAVAVEWSSSSYDYMVVAGKQYKPANPSGNSIFQIPVLAFDEPFDVVADTTAMSEPHEVDYTITVSESSIQEFDADSMAAGREGSSGSSGGSSAAAGSSSSSSASSSSGSGSAADSSSSAAGSQSSGASANAAEEVGSVSMPWVVFIICAILAALVAGIAFGIVRGARNR